jgi:hypothetical protein
VRKRVIEPTVELRLRPRCSASAASIREPGSSDLLGEHDLEKSFPTVSRPATRRPMWRRMSGPRAHLSKPAVERADVGRGPEHAVEDAARELLRLWVRASLPVIRSPIARATEDPSAALRERAAALQEQESPVDARLEQVTFSESAKARERPVDAVGTGAQRCSGRDPHGTRE